MDRDMDRDEILHWLREDDPEVLDALWAAADETRRRHVGDDVHFRGLVELTNHCVRGCAYCGIRAANREIQRYRMTAGEVMECVRMAVELGFGTVVFQGGEDYGLGTEWVADLVRQVKARTELAVTLSLGERPDEDFIAWRKAGADRYLLRFETSDPDLYRAIHPDLPGRVSDRIAMLGRLRALGYEAGSGVMVGTPGQTYQSLANDIATFRELDLDMIGIGPFIPHPATPLGNAPVPDVHNQVPADEIMVLKAVALTRLVCPDANLPSTTALATVNPKDGRERGLERGANIVMPNLTPPKYRILYEIYPDKACINETGDQCAACLRSRIESIGRTVGTGQGGRQRSSAT
jgi:biotin synthase